MTEISSQVDELCRVLLKWVDSNGLAVNLKKTTYMIFSRRRIDSNFNLLIANTHIQRKSEARFLGVIIDEKLNWSSHIKAVKSKMSRYIGIMYKLKKYLPQQNLACKFSIVLSSHI